MNDLEQRVKFLEERLNKIEGSDRFFFQKLLQLSDGRNIQVGRSVGTKISTAADQKLGFFGHAPVAQQAAITAPSGGGTVDSQARTAIGTIITTLQTLGLTA